MKPVLKAQAATAWRLYREEIRNRMVGRTWYAREENLTGMNTVTHTKVK